MTGAALRRVTRACVGVLVMAGAGHAGAPLSNDAAPIAVCQETIRTATLRLAIASRRIPRVASPRVIRPLSSGPRCSIASHMRVTALVRVASGVRGSTNPAMPHIVEPQWIA